MSYELYTTLFTVWAVLMAIVVVVLLFVKRNAVLPFLRKVVRGKPKGWKMAKRFAEQILAGKVAEEVREYLTPDDSSDKKCRNCRGGNPIPLWRPSALSKYLELRRLTNAIWKAELCGDCIIALSKIVVASKAEKGVSSAKAKDPSPAQPVATPVKSGAFSGWWSPRKKRIVFIGKGLAGTGLLIGFTVVFARFFPHPGLSELKIYLYVLIGFAGLIWINRWLVEETKKGKK